MHNILLEISVKQAFDTRFWSTSRADTWAFAWSKQAYSETLSESLEYNAVDVPKLGHTQRYYQYHWNVIVPKLGHTQRYY